MPNKLMMCSSSIDAELETINLRLQELDKNLHIMRKKRLDSTHKETMQPICGPSRTLRRVKESAVEAPLEDPGKLFRHRVRGMWSSRTHPAWQLPEPPEKGRNSLRKKDEGVVSAADEGSKRDSESVRVQRAATGKTTASSPVFFSNPHHTLIAGATATLAPETLRLGNYYLQHANVCEPQFIDPVHERSVCLAAPSVQLDAIEDMAPSRTPQTSSSGSRASSYTPRIVYGGKPRADGATSWRNREASLVQRREGQTAPSDEVPSKASSVEHFSFSGMVPRAEEERVDRGSVPPSFSLTPFLIPFRAFQMLGTAEIRSGSISSGFCSAALDAKFSKVEYDTFQETWRDVQLQIVDVQRFPAEPREAERCRFYLAASDGSALIWLVSPPHSEIEENIAQYQMEIGCLVTLHEYTLLEASNRKNVVVPLRLSFLPNSVPLIGEPYWSPSLFDLSSKALVYERKTPALDLEKTMFDGFVEVTIEEIACEPQCVLGPWQIELRFIWVGNPYRTGNSGSERSARDRQRYSLRSVAVDRNGHAIICVHFGVLSWLEKFQVQSMWRFANGSVVWEATMEGTPSHLSFNEQCQCCPITLDPFTASSGVLKARNVLPLQPVSTVGEVARAFPSVSEIIDTVPLDRVISFVAEVVSFRPGVLTRTKRGSILRANLIVADPHQRLSIIEVTLWGDAAPNIVFTRGQHYWFHNLTVREFQRKKNLSSRSDSLFILLSKELVLPPAPSTSIPYESPDVPYGEKDHLIENGVLFVLQLSLATQLLPSLARIQSIETPIVSWQCNACSAFDYPSPDIFVCPLCGGGDYSSRFRLRLTLSDGEELLEAVCYHDPAERLLGMTVDAVEQRCRCDAFFSQRLTARLTGCPVLVWLLRMQGPNETLATGCQLVDVTSCSTALIASVENYLLDEAE
eukprot:gene4421-3220_t